MLLFSSLRRGLRFTDTIYLQDILDKADGIVQQAQQFSFRQPIAVCTQSRDVTKERMIQAQQAKGIFTQRGLQSVLTAHV